MTDSIANAHSHPSHETWIDYHAGRVSDDESLKLQRHLSSCRHCVDLVLDLDAFAEPEGRQESNVLDFERAAAWRVVQGALEPRPGARRAPGWLASAAVAASLLFAAVGLSAWTLQRQTVDGLETRVAALSKVQPDVEIVDLRPGARQRSDGGVDATVELPAGVGSTLVLHLEDEVESPAYELRIVDVDGVEVDRIAISMTDLGNFVLALPPGAFDAGSYELRLFGLGAGGERSLETYPIRLR